MKRGGYSILFFFCFSILFYTGARAQDQGLMEELEAEIDKSENKEYTKATFKGTRIINGQSVETPGKGILQLLISHRFGRINEGAYGFFGLDEATIRLGLDYGINDRFTVGIGRSSIGKTYDGYLKYKLLRQSAGNESMPLTLVWYSNTAATTIERSTDEKKIALTSRLSYSHQLLLARKFNEKFSLQLSPSFIHRNVVPTEQDQNDVFALGVGGRLKISKRTSVNAEYFYLLPGQTERSFQNSVSLGFDIETGGHVFQIHIINSPGMIESQFIPQTQGDPFKGDIHIGFNVSRVFSINK